MSLNRGIPQAESSHQLFLDVQFATLLKCYSFSLFLASANLDLDPAPTYPTWKFLQLDLQFFRALLCCTYSFSDSYCGFWISEIGQHLLNSMVSPCVFNSWPQFRGPTLNPSHWNQVDTSILSLLFHTVLISPSILLEGLPETEFQLWLSLLWYNYICIWLAWWGLCHWTCAL